MQRKLWVVGVVVLAACGAQPATPAAPTPVAPTSPPAPRDAGVEVIAGFGAPGSNAMPDGWGGNPAGTVAIDDQIQHDGRRVVRLVRTTTSPAGFSVLLRTDPLDAGGTTLELRGFVRTQDMHGTAQLWLREDGDDRVVAFDNMDDRPITGATEWTAYSIRLPLDPQATQVAWGALITGDGTAWVADLRLLVDGKPIAQAPHATRPPSVIDTDHEFDHGSHVATARPTAAQIDNLATLAKVWGFVKYHHPAITAGTRHWDYELLRVLPAILDARDRAAANAVLVHWLAGLGAVPPCAPCAPLDVSILAVRPDLAWLDDRARLGDELSAALRDIYANRVVDKQYFVSLVPSVANPNFRHEPTYDAIALPDAGFQLIGLFRLWNAVEYWAPDLALADSPWDRVLTDAIPDVLAAPTAQAYIRAMAVVIARMRDGHAGLGRPDAAPPDGDCEVPVEIRFLAHHPVVARLGPGDTGDLAVGDELTAIGGAAIDKLVASWSPFYSASNEITRLRHIAFTMTRGACGNVAIDVLRDGRGRRLSIARSPHVEHALPKHDRPGDTFQLLSPDVAYVKLSSVVAADAAHYVEQAKGTKGLVIDIRNYPSEFVVFALGSLLVTAKTPFAAFTAGDLANPGAFHWDTTAELEPAEPHYAGKVVVLVDEVSQSSAEYHAMAFRAAGAIVIGSTTSGADGNVSMLPLPGGLHTYLSGIGVFYPDHKPTQGIGIVPDVTVVPTIAGIRAGRDEVLDAAIHAITGK